MPIDPTGGYRPFTDSEKQSVTSYMSNLYRQGSLPWSDIVNKALFRFKLPQRDRLAVNSMGRNAQNIVNKSALMNADPNLTINKSSTPQSTVAPGYKGQYGYNVLITVTDPRTGKSLTYSTTVYSTEPQSKSDIAATIDSDLSNYVGTMYPGKFSNAALGRAAFDITIMGVSYGV